MIRNQNTDGVVNMVLYEEALALVKNEIEEALTKSPSIISEYLTHLSISQGKSIRAVSVLTCAQNSEGMVHSDAILAAASIEIIHLASLVHDDIIDNADLRRGNPTLQKKYGKRTAVICGDYLLSLALKMLAKIPDREDYLSLSMPDYISKLCLGELNQHVNNHNLNLSVFQYLRIISGKTAALFEASFLAGAVIGKNSEADVKKYRKIGYYIGMIFQLMDDCLDFEDTTELVKKPVQSDYEQGVITLPLIHALHEADSFKQKATDTGVSRIEINDAVKLTGGLLFTKAVIGRYYSKAMKNIEQLQSSDLKKAQMIKILNKSSHKLT